MTNKKCKKCGEENPELGIGDNVSCRECGEKMTNSNEAKAKEEMLDKVWNWVGQTLDKDFEKTWGYKNNDGMYTRNGENLAIINGKEYIIEIKEVSNG